MPHLLDYGRTRYRPPATLINHVQARDRTCRFPTCNRRATTCETDHAVAWEHGGTTNAANLHALCPRHHHAKHDAGWSTIRHRDDSTTWISPSGRRYHKPAEQLPIDTTTTPTTAGTRSPPAPNQPAPGQGDEVATPAMLTMT